MGSGPIETIRSLGKIHWHTGIEFHQNMRTCTDCRPLIQFSEVSKRLSTQYTNLTDQPCKVADIRMFLSK